MRRETGSLLNCHMSLLLVGLSMGIRGMSHPCMTSRYHTLVFGGACGVSIVVLSVPECLGHCE